MTALIWTSGLFVYDAPALTVIDAESGWFETPSASITTIFPDDVTTICSVPLVVLVKVTTGSTHVRVAPASDTDLIVRPFHLTATDPHAAHVRATE